MTGVLFVICVPTENYEKGLKKCLETNGNSNLNDNKKENMQTKVTDISGHEKLMHTLENSAIDDLINSDISGIHNLTKTANKSSEKIEVTSSTFSDKCEDDYENIALEKILRKILEEEKIKNAVWTKGESSKYLQVIFPLESGTQCEGLLTILSAYGIGQRRNSVVSVIPCSIYYKEDADCDKLDSGEELKLKLKNEHAKSTAWDRFVSSVRARLTVAQVVESVKTNAALTFDFIMLLIIATILSAIALAENNNVYLVSSMLISPMMGPVMAGTFGSVIQDKKLQKIGVLNELIGLGIATFVGFCYGIIITSFSDKYGDNAWPTYEMTSRGEIRTLWVGCLIALLSGAAVALGILGDNFASLVGVAISASLMPPAVNAGLLWAMAVVYGFAGEMSSKSIVRTNFYSNEDTWELAALGGISMCLTFVNIICIYIAGILVFKIKEVAPMSSKFWKYDIKIARDYNRTLQNDDAKLISKHLSKELSNYKQTTEPVNKAHLLDLDHLYQSTELERDHISDNKTQQTWSPSSFAPKRPTIQELKTLYFSLIDKPKAQKNLNFQFPVSIQSNVWMNPSTSQNYEINDDNMLPVIPEVVIQETTPLLPTSSSSSNRFIRKQCRGNKKFVVTPAFIDN